MVEMEGLDNDRNKINWQNYYTTYKENGFCIKMTDASLYVR